MKKWIKIAGLLLLSLPIAVHAEDFTYTINGSNTITITGYTGPGGAVTIPDTTNGLPVTSIGANAFYNNTNLTSIVIPNGVTNISEGAFHFCRKLTDVTISSNVVIIGAFSFDNCSSLRSIILPNNLASIGLSAFYNCPSLPSVTIPNSVTNIGSYAFAYCSNLNSIAVEPLNLFYSSVDGVLFNKSQTTLVEYPSGRAEDYTVPNSVTNIGYRAFSYCLDLLSIKIPASLVSIGDDALSGCNSLTNITVDSLNPFYSSVDGVLFNKSQTILIAHPNGKVGSYTVPNSVTKIGSRAFFYDANLTSIRIPSSVTSIGISAFQNCKKLTQAYFEGDAPSIGASAFVNTRNLAVYYLSGTEGWGSAFGGIPTVLWNPQIQTGDAGFGVRSNRFGFNITGTNNFTVTVEACTNLTSGIWEPVATNTLTSGSVQFSDPAFTNYPSRYYRVSMPQ